MCASVPFPRNNTALHPSKELTNFVQQIITVVSSQVTNQGDKLRFLAKKCPQDKAGPI